MSGSRNSRLALAREALGPVEPVASVDLLSTTVDVNLDTITVVFNFVNPLLSLRRFSLQGCKLGLDEPRHLNTLGHKRNSQEARRS